MKMPEIMKILNDGEFKRDFTEMRVSFFKIFDGNEGLGLSEEENLALTMGVMKMGKIELFYNLVPVWFSMWSKARK